MRHEYHKETVHLKDMTIRDQPTLLRFIDCRMVILENLVLENPTGPADPHGCCVQFIRSTGYVKGCKFKAGPKACDLFSNFSNKIIKAKPLDKWGSLVILEDCEFDGAGEGDFTTSINMDGPFAPNMTVIDCVVRDARVAFMHCSGNARLIRFTTERSRQQSVWTDGQYYVKQRKAAGLPVRPGTVILQKVQLDRMYGLGKIPGKVVWRV